MTNYNYEEGIEQAKEKAREIFDAAEEEYVELLRQRDQIGFRIASVQRVLNEVGPMCGKKLNDAEEQLTFTDAIRYILGTTRTPMTPVEIRDALLASPFIDLSAHAAPLQSIHTTLKRLVNAKRANDVEVVERADGATAYKWIGGSPPTIPYAEWERDEIKKAFGKEVTTKVKKRK